MHILPRLLITLVPLLGIAGCGKVPDPWEERPGEPRVVATFPPLASWALKVSGDRAAVITLCKTIGPHSYQFNVRDTVLLQKGELLLANGLGLDDHFADKLNGNAGNADLRFSKLADKLPKTERRENKGKNEDPEACCVGEFDAHAWLGLPHAIRMVEELAEDFAAVDRTNASGYRDRAKQYIDEELTPLLSEGRAKLSKLKTPIITHHASMGYFKDTFKLNILGAVRGLDGQDAGGKKLRNLIKLCQGYERVILAVEPQYSDSGIKALQANLKSMDEKLEVIIVKFDTLETSGGEEPDADWYVRKMRENIEALAQHAK